MIFPNEVFNSESQHKGFIFRSLTFSVNRCGFGCAIHSNISMLHLKSTMIFPNEVFNSVNRCGFGCAIHSYISMLHLKSTMIFPNEVFNSESNTRVLSFAH